MLKQSCEIIKKAIMKRQEKSQDEKSYKFDSDQLSISQSIGAGIILFSPYETA